MEQKKSRKKEYLIAALVLALAVVALIVSKNGVFSKGNTDSQSGQYSVQVTVINENEDYNAVYSYETDETILGDLLVSEGLIDYEDSDYGRYITGVDGMAADDSKEQWWTILVNGESAQTGIDGIEIQDGDEYTLQMMTGY